MLAVIALLFGLFSNGYTVHFEGTTPLREGMPLLYRGVEIGSVTDVGVGADFKPVAEVRVKRKFRDLFRDGCAVSLDKGAGVLELTGADRGRPVLPDGSRVPGLSSSMDYLKFGVDKVRGGIRDLRLRNEYETLQREMTKAWERGRETFREEWPKLKRQLRDLKDTVGPELKEEFERLEKEWDGKAEKE